jgi:uncharacterized membrane protein YjdF
MSRRDKELGTVTVPPPQKLAFYAVLGVLAALEIIEWPVALVVGVGGVARSAE